MRSSWPRKFPRADWVVHGTLPLLRPFLHPIRRSMSPVRPSRAMAVCYRRFDSPPNRRQSGCVPPIE
jgi:hypothetical protein